MTDVSDLLEELSSEYSDELINVPNATLYRKRLTESAAVRLERIVRFDASDTNLQRSLASAYEKLASIQGNANLGENAAALDTLYKALALRESLIAAHPDQLEYRMDLAHCYDTIGVTLRYLGNTSEAVAFCNRAVAVGNDLLNAHWDSLRIQLHLLDVYEHLVRINLLAGSRDGCKETAQQAKLLISQIDFQALTELKDRRTLRDVLGRLADSLARCDCLSEAVDTYSNSLAVQATESDSIEAADVAAYHRLKSRMLFYTGNKADAVRVLAEWLAMLEAIVRTAPENIVEHKRLLAGYTEMGQMLEEANQRSRAIDYYSRCLRIAKDLTSKDTYGLDPRIRTIESYNNLGTAYRRSESHGKALKQYQHMLAMAREMRAIDPESIMPPIYESTAWYRIAESLVSLGRLSEAITSFAETIRIREALSARDPQNINLQKDLAFGYIKSAELQERLAQQSVTTAEARVQYWRAAKVEYERGCDLLRDLNNRGVLVNRYLAELVRVERIINAYNIAPTTSAR